MSVKKDLKAIREATGIEHAYVEKKLFKREYVIYGEQGKETYEVSGKDTVTRKGKTRG